ncbi:Na(+)/H(+) exchange regulatory cofactor NHE-RF1 [Geodia barretti]|uniref:Na(+)/H(+) exchange regulatory cofactor NHE-RF1 n=1 Tax=Geodia barretti TaxID=519541 RepID=A0AA35TLT7_GEOBA|nr:Na(+)/H(+) exchange regulatory cofactor NHE-RF1 [Geodia barretti]
MASGKEGGALKGLRLLTINRRTKGFGFHMFTNKALKGQYIKAVFPGEPADLAGMLNSDHVLEVDGVDVTEMTHMEVVEQIRSGTGPKKILVIDMDTEREMVAKGEAIDRKNAVEMIPRSAATEETDAPPEESAKEKALNFDDMTKAFPKGAIQRQKIKSRDWKASVAVYNDL